MRQGQNVETDICSFETVEENSGDAKYVGNGCKVMIENKAIVDKFVLDGCLVDFLQVCGLGIFFGNTTLVKLGPYIGTHFYTSNIDKSLRNISRYYDLTPHRLCFRVQCVAIANQYEEHLNTIA